MIIAISIKNIQKKCAGSKQRLHYVPPITIVVLVIIQDKGYIDKCHWCKQFVDDQQS